MEKCPLCKSDRIEGNTVCHECGYLFDMDDMHESDTVDPLIGKVLDNKYIITEKIGTGGMGAVYKGEQKFLEKIVAIKVLDTDGLNDERAIKMFYREARLASRLNHPNSITIYDFGKTEDNILYMVMEFLRGESLSSFLSDGHIPFVRTASIIRQVALALESAHKIGLVHRDLKPENIFIEQLGDGYYHVTVLDFGIAKNIKKVDVSLTSPGMVWGTPLYMSPEQATGKELDFRTDIYSMGIVLYEMLCGEPPFVSENPTEILISHVHDEPVPPSTVAPYLNIPPALENISLWAIAKKPDDRISSASEFRKIIESWLAVNENLASRGKCPVCGGNLAPGTKKCPICQHEIHTSTININNSELLKEMEISESPISEEIPSGNSKGILPPIHTSTMEVDIDEIIDDIDKIIGNSTTEKVASESLRKVEIEKLHNLLMQGRSAVISGEKGVGKSYFLKEFKLKYGDKFSELVLVDFCEVEKGMPLAKFRKFLQTVVGMDYLSNLGADIHDVDCHRKVKIVFELIDDEFVPSCPKSWMKEARVVFSSIVEKYLNEHPNIPIITGLENITDFNDVFWKTIMKVYGFHNGAPVIVNSNINLPKMDITEWGKIELFGLNIEQLVSLSARILGESPSDKLQELFSQISGNPFYLRQLLNLHLEHNLPSEIRSRNDILEIRINQLPSRSREVLQILSLQNSGLSLKTIKRILSHPEDELKGAIDILKQKGMVLVQKGIYRLEHQIWNEIVDANIPAELRKDYYKTLIDLHNDRVLNLSLFKIGQFSETIEDFFVAMEVWENLSLFCENFNLISDAVEFMGRAFSNARRYWMINPSMEEKDFVYIVKTGTRLAGFLKNEGNFDASLSTLNELLDLVSIFPRFSSTILIEIAKVYYSTGIFSKTELYLERYLNLQYKTYHNLSDDAYILLIQLYNSKGDTQKVLDIISHYLMNIQCGYFHWSVINEIANFHFYQGDKALAHSWWIIARIVAEDNLDGIVEIEDQLYRYYMESGKFNLAESHLYALLFAKQKNEDRLGEGHVLIRIAQLALQNNDMDRARSLFAQTMKIALELDWKDGISMSKSFSP